MSGNINNARASKGKGMGKSAARAMEANERLMRDVLKDGIDENEMRFGQVERIIGHGQFMVHLADGRTVTSTIRALFASKRGTPISLGTIVLIHLPNWEKDALTKNPKPVSFIEGILDNDTHVPVLKHRGELPEWMFNKSDGTTAKPEAASFEFVSEEAEQAILEDERRFRRMATREGEEEEEDDDDDAPSASNSAAAAPSRGREKARAVKIEKARSAKASGDSGPINIDDI
jgi:translation initiation factor IF-1